MSEALPQPPGHGFHGSGGAAGPTLSGGASGYTGAGDDTSGVTPTNAIRGWSGLMRALSSELPSRLVGARRARQAILRSAGRHHRIGLGG